MFKTNKNKTQANKIDEWRMDKGKINNKNIKPLIWLKEQNKNHQTIKKTP